MCEQTEINYLDGDVVWVKLGACWWPGEVTSFDNLPEDIQAEFRKKPLIAAVKFFQEDTYEFVKNLHQIYKYNCTQKDEFIKKGLDKYRTKSKDGSNYMDKFPGDVEMAEKLTGGNPNILTSEKFSPEEKPDISALFGEKKIPKRKRDSDNMNRRSDGGIVARKITHPRFLRESDHEIRIRQQPSSLPSTPKTPASDSPQFSCHLCNFTSSRVNVIICHTKSHRSGSFESPISRPRISAHAPPKSAGRPSTGETQKRKYVRKTKSLTSKSKTERESEPVKRKYTKQMEKSTPTTKKKKTDPELREKLLADWDDESDEDMDLDFNKTLDSSIGSASNKTFDSAINTSQNVVEKMEEDGDDGAEILKASEKLLRDTEKFTTLLGGDSPSRAARNSNNKISDDLNAEDSSTSLMKDEKSPLLKKHKKCFAPEDAKQKATPEKDDKHKTTAEKDDKQKAIAAKDDKQKAIDAKDDKQKAIAEKDDKQKESTKKDDLQSRFSCFDFDEEDLPEPTITPVRKIPRIFGEKNTSVKKEILKKFTMSQALKNERREEEAERAQQDFSRKKNEEDEKQKKEKEEKKEKKERDEKKDKKEKEDKKEKKVKEEKKEKIEKEAKKEKIEKETKKEKIEKEAKKEKIEKEAKKEKIEKEAKKEKIEKEAKKEKIEKEAKKEKAEKEAKKEKTEKEAKKEKVEKEDKKERKVKEDKKEKKEKVDKKEKRERSPVPETVPAEQKSPAKEERKDDDITKAEILASIEDPEDSLKMNITETTVEIVEILEVVGEKEGHDESDEVTQNPEKEELQLQQEIIAPLEKNYEIIDQPMEMDVSTPTAPTEKNDEISVETPSQHQSEIEDISLNKRAENQSEIDDISLEKRAENQSKIDDISLEKRAENQSEMDDISLEKRAENQTEMDDISLDKRAENQSEMDDISLEKRAENQTEMDDISLEKRAENQSEMDDISLEKRTESRSEMDDVSLDKRAENQSEMDNIPLDKRAENQSEVDDISLDKPAENQSEMDDVSLDKRAENVSEMEGVSLDKRAENVSEMEDVSLDKRSENLSEMEDVPLNKRAENLSEMDDVSLDKRAEIQSEMDDISLDKRAEKQSEMEDISLDKRAEKQSKNDGTALQKPLEKDELPLEQSSEKGEKSLEKPSKKDEMSLEERSEKLEISPEKSSEISLSKPSEIQPEKPKIMSEIATIETEDERVSELAESLQGHSDSSDTDLLRALVSRDSPSKAKVKSPKVVKEIVEKVAPRRRGRPRKNPVVSEPSGNGDDCLKIETAPKQKVSPASRDSEHKTSESDSDRSYSGRRRKPNKRYLYSEIYAHSPDNRASKTDESQSESEEKLQKEPKGRTRRGRKSAGIVETRVETHEQNKDQEFEFSSPPVETTEIQDEAGVSKIPDNDHNLQDKKLNATETESESNASSTFDFGKKFDAIGSPVNITKFLSGDVETPKQEEETKDKLTQNEKIVKTLPASEEMEVHEEPKIVTKFDKLPPKKSQIKKFELSQIDLLEACSVQVAAESAGESSKVFPGETKMDVCSVEPTVETAVENLPEKNEKIEETPIVPENTEASVKTTDNAAEELVKSSTIETVEAELARLTNEKMAEEMVDDPAIVDEKIEIPAIVEEKIEVPAIVEEKIEVPAIVEEKVEVAAVVEEKVEIPATVVEKIEIPAIVEKQIEVPAIVEEKIEVPAIVEEKIKIPAIVEEKIEIPAIVEEKSDIDVKIDPIPAEEAHPVESIFIPMGTAQTSHKEIYPTKTPAKEAKKVGMMDVPVNSFQEAFLKTLEVDKDIRKEKEAKRLESLQENVAIEAKTVAVVNEDLRQTQTVPTLNAMTEFEGVEILVQENLEVNAKLAEANASQMDLASSLASADAKLQEANALSLDLQKIEDTLTDAVSAPSPTPDICVPVKKREKPRIIENVTLKEPMQILKSKLLEKLPSKKHKLESDTPKRSEPKGAPRAKIMKIDTPSPKRSPTKSHFTVSRKLQALKAEKSASLAAEKGQEKGQIPVAQTITHPADGEKFIQQSSQSLADMELDINSMPFVLSEDVLTPESIEQMPVVISSIIPSSSSPSTIVPSSPSSSTSAAVPTSLNLTPTSQLVAPNQVQTVTTETSTSGKKKSGTPAILKSKGKAKPTITSIKTLVPPLTGGVKGIKFQSPQGGKAMPLISQKSTPGKYVIVQTGGQQMHYSVQGKPGMSQKIAIPAGKGAGNPQIVQQGGKVVILTSAQSGQTRMLPLNISKTLSGKVQKIVNNKGQLYTPISPQGLMTSKTIIAPKSDASSPTTSKLAAGQKIINTQGIITSKGVLTPISTSKSALLSTLSQGIITKGGLYTPISSAQLAGKTIISGKAIVNKAGTILSSIGSQGLGTSKTVLAPISHTLSAKTLINTQGIVTPKGTVLTPITGQQVKALAAKSPAKGAKVHYQTVQQKLQLPMLQKGQKIPMSSSSQTRVSSGVKSPGGSGTIVFQNAILPGQKVTTLSGKKIVRQVVGVRSPQTAATQTAVTQTSTASPQQLVQQKGKSPTVQRVVTPKGRQTKAQQKIVVQKLQETTTSGATPLMNIQGKPSMSIVGNVGKTSQKSPAAHRGSAKANRNAQQQKQMLNVALSSITTASNETATSPHKQTQVQPPALAPLVMTDLPISEHEGISKTDKSPDNLGKDSKIEAPRDQTGESQKIEENKVPAQPQIMALPTESSDGTQTYVLVTIDEQGQIQPLDNNTLMSLEGTTQNADGTRTLYIDPSSLGETGALDNIVLQFDNGAMPSIQPAANVGETSQSVVSTESFSSSEIIQTSNQDILAAALANTDFQQEIGLPDNTASSVMTGGLTQTSLINQTILQSTIIPPTEPISSPSVLETSLTLNQPIMTPLEVPTSMPIQVDAVPPSVSNIPTSLELPITITNPNISYIASSAAGETHIQIPGNSMPDIGEIMESSASAEIAQEIPASTQYLVLPSLDDSMTIQAQTIETVADAAAGAVSYSVSIPESAVIETTQVQKTPSMPIIDDSFAESTEQSFEAPASDILETKATEVPETPETSKEATSASPEAVSTEEAQKIAKEATETRELFPERETTEEMTLPVAEEATVGSITISEPIPAECSVEKETAEKMEVDAEPSIEAIAAVTVSPEETAATEMQVEVQSSESLVNEATNSSEVPAPSQAAEEAERRLDSLKIAETLKDEAAQGSSSLEAPTQCSAALETEMVVEPAAETEREIYPRENSETPIVAQSVEASSQAEAAEPAASETVERMDEAIAETSQEEAPSQSYEQFNSSNVPSDSIDSPTQSAGKSENSREPSQSIVYDPMEIDENIVSGEPPTQSFDDSKQNEASQSYETSVEVNTNAPTQSFNEIMQCQEDGNSATNAIDDQSFPTQSYEVGKMENLLENLESDGAVSQEGNIPSQSNDIGIDGIGTSSVSTNNLGLNEDETASSSYMPETPENQERDQDQESAISTSSYEIPPCEELNIASSSVIPDTSASAEHTSIHDNGVPEIPTSSYSLNPDSSSTSHVDTLPTSSYEDQVIVEQNVSTSYEVPISMPGLEENSSQNFVTESTDHRDEPTSYYARHPEVSASYYESVRQDSNSRLEADHPQEEVTPSYYENPQEASQSYFRPTPRYSSQSVSPSYYEAAPESEASQSYYSHDIEATEQSSRNVEASQSFYQETNDEMRLRQQGEATPTYTERYPVDYALANSPIERHDLVESSVPATRPTER